MAAPSPRYAGPVKPMAVTVNGVEISRETIAQEVQNHPSKSPFEAWKSAARALAIRELLLQEAARLGLEVQPLTDEEGRRETDDEARVRGVVEREVVTPEPDEDSCRRYYGRNLRRFRSPDLFEVSHILVAAPPGDRDARAAALRLAEALVEQLRSAPGAFATLARRHSACPSKEVGGNLGQIGPGQTVPEFEQALAAIPAGTVHAAPVETRYGFHVVRIDRRHEGRQLPFDIVQTRIAAYLGEHVRRTAIRQYIGLLAGRATVDGTDLAGSGTPLVQ